MSSLIEFPEYKVAISVLELFANLINPALFGLEPLATDTEEITILLADCTVKDAGADFGAMIESYGLTSLTAVIYLRFSTSLFLDLTNGECQRNLSGSPLMMKYSSSPVSCCEITRSPCVLSW